MASATVTVSATLAPAAEARADFTGVWKLERTENQAAFMRAVGYNFVLARTACLACVTQTIEHQGEDISFKFESMPALTPTRRLVIKTDGAQETPLQDDAGREMLLTEAEWQGEVLTARLHYVSPRHDLTFERYIDGEGRMVEHLRYAEKGIETKRIFKRQA